MNKGYKLIYHMLEVENLKNKIICDPSDIKIGVNQIISGDTLDIVNKLPDNSYSSCITSPPYWGIRDYDEENQIGAEEELDEFIHKIVLIFRTIKKKLRDDGTLWLNIGDTYTSGNRKRRAPDKKNQGREMSYRPATPKGLKSKDLIGVPWRIAFALQKDGWYLRSDIIWHKPNCQPESVKDRPTRSHEYVFLFSRSAKYFYDYEKLREPTNRPGISRNLRSGFMTIISVDIDYDILRKESPTTNYFFNLARIQDFTTDEHRQFKEIIQSNLSIF